MARPGRPAAKKDARAKGPTRAGRSRDEDRTRPPRPADGTVAHGAAAAEAPAPLPPSARDPLAAAARAIPDGATARRASQATSRFREGPGRVAPLEVGPGLDPHAAETRRRSPFAEELRRIETGAGAAVGASAARRGLAHVRALTERVLDSESYRRELSALLMRNRSEVVDEFGLDPVYAERWRPLFEFLYRSYFRVETSGMENLPDRGRAIIVANHSGTLPYDGAMLMYAIRYDHPAHRDVRPLVEDFIIHFPFIGVVMNRTGCVRACQENGERLLRQERVVALFPEGVMGIGKLYRDRYQLQRFGRGGFIKLALKTKTPIIPAAIIGAEEIHPMLGKVQWLAKHFGIPYLPITPTFPWLGVLGTVPLPTKWFLRFGEPLDFAARYREGAIEDRVLINQLSEQVRSTIQKMVDELLSNRRSVLFG
jgi:1-acyl-sn-glycerol-3-phosphate acyltransferase